MKRISLDDSQSIDAALLQTTLGVPESLANEPYQAIIMELSRVAIRGQQALYMALRERNPELPVINNHPPFSWPLSVIRLLTSLEGLGYEMVEDHPKDTITRRMKAVREWVIEPIIVESCGPIAALAQVVLLAHQQTKPRISLPS